MGHWEGSLSVQGQEFEIVVDLDRGADGAWKGEIDIPVQGIRNLALESVTTEAAAVSFKMPGIPGDPTFHGTIAEDGSSIAGSMAQAGQSFPFKLTRKGAPTLGAKPADGVELVDKGVPGKGIEGEWHGVLSVGPSTLRLILHVKKAPDGSFAATVDSIDQKASGLPVSKLTFEGRALAFEMGSIPASYTGTMSEDGSKITGAWGQGGGTAPLELLRSGR